MNRAEIRQGIEEDLRISPSKRIIYLEGKTDVEFLFGLTGRPTPPGNVEKNVFHQGVLVKACNVGSGSTAVRAHVEVASEFHHPEFVCGIIDGDGLLLDQLAASFDPPHPGPLFAWKSYCIENLLAKTGWPPAWGDEPDWPAELSKYGPYVALNRVGLEARAILSGLGLMNFLKPVLSEALKASTEIASALAAGKAKLLSFDVERRFDEELSAFEAAARRSLDEAHALLNGKWLVRHLAPTVTKRDPDVCKYEWLAHARSVGGLPEVREWWERVTGNPP